MRLPYKRARPLDASPIPRADPGRPMTFDAPLRAPADQTTVRRANLGVVLRHVAAGGSLSRARIAADTGLTRGTVSSLVSELIDLELLRETGETTSPRGVGRPGVGLELADVVVGIGLEVNVDYVAVSVEDLTGTVRYERRSYHDNRGSAPGPVLDRLARAARTAIEAVDRDGLRTIGVSVAVPGLVEEASGTVVFAPNLGWQDLPVAAELEERLGPPGARRERVEPRGARGALDGRRRRDRRLRLRLRRGRRRAAASCSVVGSSVAPTASAASSVTSPSTRTARCAGAAAAGASRRWSARSRSHAPQASRPSRAGRAASRTSWCAGPSRGTARGRPRAGRSGMLARHRARIDVQPLRRPGRRPRRLLRPARAVARGRRAPDAAGALAGRPLRDVSSSCRRLSATAPPCGARRHCHSTVCSTRLGRCRPRAGASDAAVPRRRANGPGGRLRSLEGRGGRIGTV